jgi:hypothetical protein
MAHTYCLDCNAPTTNKVFCPRCLDTDSSIQPRCPCGAAIIGPGAYCTSRCVRAYAPKTARVTVDDEPTMQAVKRMLLFRCDGELKEVEVAE